MMKGDWLLVLALRDRAAKESLPVVEEEEYGDLAIWLQQKFDGYFAILVKKNKKKTSECWLHLLYYTDNLKNEKQKRLLCNQQRNSWLPRPWLKKKQWEVYIVQPITGLAFKIHLTENQIIL